MSVPPHELLRLPLLSTFAVGEAACCGISIALFCELEKSLAKPCAMVAVCWLLPSGITNNEASTITSVPPNRTPGSTKRRLRCMLLCEVWLRTRLIEAGMTMGTLLAVSREFNGAVEFATGNFTMESGDSLPPGNGLVTRGSGEENIVQPRSTKSTFMDGL